MRIIADPAKLKAAQTYDAASDHFDDEPLGFWARYGRHTIDRLALRPGMSVLDVGCGTGASALPAAEAVGPGGSVIGIDLAGNLLEIARRKASMRGLANVRFEIGDMEALNYPDDHFDAVVCVFAIFFVPDMTKQVRELWRMVRPGGQLAITTWGPRMFEPGSSAWWAAVKEVRPDLVAAFNPWDRITRPQAVQHLLREVGIAEAEVVAATGRQPLREPDDWWAVVLGSGYRWTVEQLGPIAAEQVRKTVLARLRAENATSIETNVILAKARKQNPRAAAL